MKSIPETGYNKFDNYKYSKLSDYVSAVREVIARHGLSISFAVSSIEHLETRVTSGGKNEYPVVVEMRALLMHSSGESLEFSSFGMGQDRGDKALYKAITGARKYMLAQVFNLATEDDPESGVQPQETAPKSKRDPIKVIEEAEVQRKLVEPKADSKLSRSLPRSPVAPAPMPSGVYGDPPPGTVSESLGSVLEEQMAKARASQDVSVTRKDVARADKNTGKTTTATNDRDLEAAAAAATPGVKEAIVKAIKSALVNAGYEDSKDARRAIVSHFAARNYSITDPEKFWVGITAPQASKFWTFITGLRGDNEKVTQILEAYGVPFHTVEPDVPNLANPSAMMAAAADDDSQVDPRTEE